MSHTQGWFAQHGDGQNQGTPDTRAWHLPHVLDFNWARTQDDLESTQYQYLANTVFENYSMHLEARRQSSMERAQFLRHLRLLYPNMSTDAGGQYTFAGSGPERDADERKQVKQQSPSSHGSNLGQRDTFEPGVAVKPEPEGDADESKEVKQPSPSSHGSNLGQRDTFEPVVAVQPELGGEHSETGFFSSAHPVHAPSLRASVQATESVDRFEPEATVPSRDDKYREKKEELQRLVSTVLYLTEMYGVAQTRGGAQVSQYRRTLTAQSHTLLVQRLARELQQTEAGFWAWLDSTTTPPPPHI